MKDSGGLVPLTTLQDFPSLRVYAAKNAGIVIGFQQLEGGGFFLELRNFVIGISFWVIGMLAAYGIFESEILLRLNIPEGVPLALAALLAAAFCLFGIPFALVWWTEISPTPPFLARREIQIDPMRDQVRVYRGKKMETVRPLSQFHTTTVEEHPKAEIERRKHPGKVGKYQKQYVLFGWFGMGGGEKVPLLSRWEYPYQNSLVEVQKAIDLAKTLADKIGEAAKSGGVIDMAGMPGGAGAAGIKPPLD